MFPVLLLDEIKLHFQSFSAVFPKVLKAVFIFIERVAHAFASFSGTNISEQTIELYSPPA